MQRNHTSVEMTLRNHYKCFFFCTLVGFVVFALRHSETYEFHSDLGGYRRLTGRPEPLLQILRRDSSRILASLLDLLLHLGEPLSARQDLCHRRSLNRSRVKRVRRSHTPRLPKSTYLKRPKVLRTEGKCLVPSLEIR
jgi:hypothetical protein